MNWHQVPLDPIKPAPWRNGGGTTRELLAWPHPEAWNVRVSIAEVSADGPFSTFPGVTRWFAVLAGERVKMRVGGDEHVLGAGSPPLCFDGGTAAHCGLASGATEDFNLMLRGREGRLERVSGRQERACRKGSLVGVYSHEHEVAFLAVEVRIVIPPRTLAWNLVPTDERIDFSTAGALWFEAEA
jgi:environmental stress-induced protein Ves